MSVDVKIKPSLEWSDDQIPANSTFSNVTEIERYDPQNDELEILTAEPDASTEQPGRYKGLISRELAWKRCEWFHGMPETASLNVASSLSRDKRSVAPSPKHIYGRLKFQRQRSSSSVCSFKPDDSEFGLDGSSRASSTAPSLSLPTVVPIRLPPGCIPEEMTVQVPGSTTPLTTEARSFIIVDTQLELDPQQELDPWVSDICEQALSMGSTDQPCLFPSLVSPASIVFHEVEEDVSLENNILSNYALKMFLQNKRVVYRRNAICEELEMDTGFVKINGAKFSLWHLRSELQNTLNICNL